jgi:hypothetical protein
MRLEGIAFGGQAANRTGVRYCKVREEYSAERDRISTKLVFRRRVFRRYSRQPFRRQQRPQQEKLMPAGCTSYRWKPQKTSDTSEHSRNLLRRYSLQLQVAANTTSCIQEVAKRYGPRVKAHLTNRATPWNDTHSAEQIFGNGPPPRSPASRGLTRWTVHRKILEGLFARG